MVGLVETALLRSTTAPMRAPTPSRSSTAGSPARRPHVWTTLGHTVLLAHLAADHGLAEYCGPLLAELEPFGDRIAVIGQVGSQGRSRWPPRVCTRWPVTTSGRGPTSRG